MAYPAPERIHLTSHRQAWALLFPVAAIAVVTLAAGLSYLLFGDPALDAAGVSADWTGPLLGIGAIVAAALLVWTAIVTGSRAGERRRARLVHRDGLARWPQYATEAQWRQVIEKDSRPDGGWLETAIPIGIVTAVLAAIAVPAGVQRLWSVVVVLAAFGLLVAGLVAGRQWNQRRERRTDRVRREGLTPFPSCVVSAEALYHEDWGLLEIDKLADVQLVPPDQVPGLRKRLLARARAGELDVRLEPLDTRLARSGWSLLQLTLDSRLERTLWHQVAGFISSSDHGRDPMPVTVLHVRVPPGREPEAGQVVALLRNRWLATRGPLW